MPKVTKNIKNLRKKFCEFPPRILRGHAFCVLNFMMDHSSADGKRRFEYFFGKIYLDNLDNLIFWLVLKKLL